MYLRVFADAQKTVETMTEVELKVEMTCSGCSGAVEKLLTRSKDKGEGIESFEVNLETQKVTIVLSQGSALNEDTLIGKVRWRGVCLACASCHAPCYTLLLSSLQFEQHQISKSGKKTVAWTE